MLAALLGVPLDALFNPTAGVPEGWRAFELPIWDLIGQHTGQPVYALAATVNDQPIPARLRVPCYDTSLYIDDLHLSDNAEAAQLMAEEARAGWARGHRAFKLKIGRGARHMPLEAGTARDIAVIRAVRTAIGAQAPLMLDANNGYNLNLAKHVLRETAECHPFWLEEPFHEDAVLYQDLKSWQKEEGLNILVADGEGEASTHLLDWAHQGLIDVVQYDIFSHGLTNWLHTGQQLDAWGVRSAPHHYGSHYGNYASCHLAAAILHFSFVEWDEASTPGLDASGYAIKEGFVHVAATPGFGLVLDEERFAHAVTTAGGRLSL
jgi:L-alanine-DL-glutamate epimerase-like enolase superfamily enzyme